MTRITRIVRHVLAHLLYGSGQLWRVKRKIARCGVVVLTFHRVLDDDEFLHTSSLPGMCIRQRTFEQLICWIKQNCEVVDLKKGLPEWQRPSNKLRIALTFDDGWLDNYHSAYPSLWASDCPATVFICPGLLDRPFPFWPEQVALFIKRVWTQQAPQKSQAVGETILTAIEQLKAVSRQNRLQQIEALKQQVAGNGVLPLEDEPSNRTMSWQDLHEVHRKGIAVGSHTVSHEILTTLSTPEIRDELTESRREIETRLGDVCRTLAYPNGNHDIQTQQVAEEVGYEFAFTTQRGYWTSNTDTHRIPRVNVSELKLTDLRGRFSGIMAEYSLFWNLVPGPVRDDNPITSSQVTRCRAVGSP